MLLAKAINIFKKYLAVEKAYSPLTIKEYVMDLNLLYDYLSENYNTKQKENLEVEKIDKYQIADFLADIILIKENSPSTRNRKLYSIRSFFKYLHKNNIIKNNPTLTIEASKTKNNAEPIYMKLNDASRYIKAIEEYDSINKIRDIAIIKLFLYAGLRVSELVNLNIENIDFEYKLVKFYGKGNKERILPLHEDILKAINIYIKLDRKKMKIKDKSDSDALFLSRQGRRISVRSIQLMVKKYAKLAGVKNASKITPHKLRHTFASLLYYQTKDLKVLQELLGHADISTTQIYTHTDIEEKKEAINELPKI
ncbi:tyrosine-type recombinase/integrase [Natronospora cellulosivora (SeqCode)]